MAYDPVTIPDGGNNGNYYGDGHEGQRTSITSYPLTNTKQVNASDEYGFSIKRMKDRQQIELNKIKASEEAWTMAFT